MVITSTGIDPILLLKCHETVMMSNTGYLQSHRKVHTTEHHPYYEA